MAEKVDWQTLDIRISNVFQPSSPINSEKLFRGRKEQARAVVDTINQPGRHAIIFGGRGVGKTSLGKTLQKRLSTAEPTPIISPYITCDSSDNFSSIWRKAMLEALDMIGIRGSETSGFYPYSSQGTELFDWTPYDVRRAIEPISQTGLLYFVFDEFDKVEDPESRQKMADTIKLLSDHTVAATLILIGVADDAIGLIDDHRSIERCLEQIAMPRMPQQELVEIVEKGLESLGMTISEDAIDEITGLAKGLPTYVHLLSLHASRAAVDQTTLHLTLDHVRRAVDKAISHSEATIRHEYDVATLSSRHNTLYPSVLLACAMAKTDDHGRFLPNDVCGPLRTITGQSYKSTRFNSHLKALCEASRGHVLRKIGADYRWRYQFTNPLLQPYVIMKGLHEGKVTEADLQLRRKEEYPLFPSSK